MKLSSIVGTTVLALGLVAVLVGIGLMETKGLLGGGSLVVGIALFVVAHRMLVERGDTRGEGSK